MPRPSTPDTAGHPSRSAADAVLHTDGFILAVGLLPRDWPQFPQDIQLGLLVGNWLPCFDLTFRTQHAAQEWFTMFLSNTHRELGKVWKARLRLIEDRYGPLPSDPTDQED